MGSRHRRWHPPGTGWVRTFDAGRVAVWMRPPLVGGLDIAAYIESSYDPWGYVAALGRYAEAWVVWVPRESWLPYEVMDKPHRIGWSLTSHERFAGTVLSRTVLPASHRGHRRMNSNRRVYRWPLPRRILAALAD
jgi:hypothetical protein